MTEKRVLPAHVQPYAKTPVFTADTVPSRLLSHHDLKSGTWGLLHVEKGTVRFFVEDDKEPTAILNEGAPFVILPEERHYVQLSDNAAFYVAFHK